MADTGMKISDLTSEEAQDILKHGDRKQMVLDAEKELKTKEPKSRLVGRRPPKHALYLCMLSKPNIQSLPNTLLTSARQSFLKGNKSQWWQKTKKRGD